MRFGHSATERFFSIVMSCFALILLLATAPSAMQPAPASLWAIEGGTILIPWPTGDDTPTSPQIRLTESAQVPTMSLLSIKQIPRTERHWSWPTTRTAVDQVESAGAHTWLMLQLPEEPQGNLTVQGQDIPLTWVAPRPHMPPLHLGPSNPEPPTVESLCTAEGAPPLDDPMQAWRWELLAAR